MLSPRTLTVRCGAGLGNRLMVLLSGLALSEASDRKFQMLWPLTPHCAAPFSDLFATPWPVETSDTRLEADGSSVINFAHEKKDLLSTKEAHLRVRSYEWLILPYRYPAHAKLTTRCQELFATLEPTASILQPVEEFRQRHFRSHMIGVHLRRGDKLLYSLHDVKNTDLAVAEVDRFLDAYPDAGILLCTDDGAPDPRTLQPTHREGVREIFQQRYGTRVVSPIPRTLDRSTPEAIQDALVDLWLLRATNSFVASGNSSFSSFVIYGRDVPYVRVSGPIPVNYWEERIARATGIYALLRTILRIKTGKDLPYHAVSRSVKTAPKRWAQRLMRRLR
jgi:hypothetical protein